MGTRCVGWGPVPLVWCHNCKFFFSLTIAQPHSYPEPCTLRPTLNPTQAFEFAVPPGSDLTFSPHVGEVPPQSRLRVQITHMPRPPEEGEEDALQAEAEAAAALERQEQEEEEERQRAAAADLDDEEDSEGGGLGAGGIAAVLAGRRMVGAGAGVQRGLLGGAGGGRAGSPGLGGDDGWGEELDEPPSGSPRGRRAGSPQRGPGSPSGGVARGGSRGADGRGGGAAAKGVKVSVSAGVFGCGRCGTKGLLAGAPARGHVTWH